MIPAARFSRGHISAAAAAAAQDGRTALMWAAAEGHADCARLLLDAGADKEVKDQVRYHAW